MQCVSYCPWYYGARVDLLSATRDEVMFSVIVL